MTKINILQLLYHIHWTLVTETEVWRVPKCVFHRILKCSHGMTCYVPTLLDFLKHCMFVFSKYCSWETQKKFMHF